MLNQVPMAGYSKAVEARLPFDPPQRPESKEPLPVVEWPEDQLELSGLTVGEALETLDDPRLQDIQRRIAAGTYLTEDKLGVVLDRLHGLLTRMRADNEPLSA